MKTIIMKIVMAKTRRPNGLFFFAKFTKPIMKTYRKGDKIMNAVIAILAGALIYAILNKVDKDKK